MLMIDTGEDRIFTVTVDGSEVELTIGPDDFKDVAASFKWLQENELWNEILGGRLAANYKIMRRVTAWKGVCFPDGSEAHCTEETKLRFFGKYPEALLNLIRQLEKAEEDDRKN